MNEEYLIKNTTRAQREKIVEESLGGGIGCEDCFSSFYDMYEPYIDGKMEIDEITRNFNRSYLNDMDRLPRESCQYTRG